jgi:mRNA-degrading endonuclease RelE of RelBE toxin-antitoxin system
MRSSRDLQTGTTYTVDISPSAWGQLATLTTDDYARIRVQLDILAARLHLEPASPDTRSVVVEAYRVFYAVDAERKRLTLLDITQRPQEK